MSKLTLYICEQPNKILYIILIEFIERRHTIPIITRSSKYNIFSGINLILSLITIFRFLTFFVFVFKVFNIKYL
ncbi:hypothetical protein HZS_7771 [Henneguya salminicola]|nr:hypothetical protein HZS_7771 [Henneguya salminicola]